jgi:hypothetical protein
MGLVDALQRCEDLALERAIHQPEARTNEDALFRV